MVLRVAILAMALVASAFGQAPTSFEGRLDELPQVRYPQAGAIVSGAIEATHVEALKKAGVRHVINLRPAQENPGFDEAKVVTEHGMQYHAIAIKGPQSLTKENVDQFERILTAVGEEPVLIHCSSGNRVGAMIALREAWIEGQPAEQAITEGKRWGLAGLEGSVRAALKEDKDQDATKR